MNPVLSLLLNCFRAEIPGQTTPKKATTLKMPDLPNTVEAKTPFSASNYKKVTFRPPEEQHRTYQSKDQFTNAIKGNSKPTKASGSSGNKVEHNSILKQSGVVVHSGSGSNGNENSGTRQTQLIRGGSNLLEEATRDRFDDNSGQSSPPANTIGLVCSLFCLSVYSALLLVC